MCRWNLDVIPNESAVEKDANSVGNVSWLTWFADENKRFEIFSWNNHVYSNCSLFFANSCH